MYRLHDSQEKLKYVPVQLMYAVQSYELHIIGFTVVYCACVWKCWIVSALFVIGTVDNELSADRKGNRIRWKCGTWIKAIESACDWFAFANIWWLACNIKRIFVFGTKNGVQAIRGNHSNLEQLQSIKHVLHTGDRAIRILMDGWSGVQPFIDCAAVITEKVKGFFLRSDL